jgi:tetratricopeptide (TPR) repeat protein
MGKAQSARIVPLVLAGVVTAVAAAATPPLPAGAPAGNKAGAEKTPDDKALRKSVAAFLDGLGAAWKSKDAKRLAAYIDFDRMFEEWRKAGALPPGLTARAEAALKAGAKTGFADVATQADSLLVWGRPEIRHLKRLAGPGEVAVIVFHREQGLTGRMRWWLKKHGAGWRVYDFESLEIGLRTSALVASLIPKDFGVVPDWIKAGKEWPAKAGAALARGDLDTAERTLAGVSKYKFPPPLEAIRWLMTGALQLDRNKPAEALAALDKARSFNPDMPMLNLLSGTAFNQQGQYEKALDRLRAYADLLGEDSLTSFQLGFALAGLGRMREAAGAYRRSLDDNPDFPDALDGLRRVLPRAGKDELAARFARLTRPREDFESLANLALGDFDAEGVEALAAVLLARQITSPALDLSRARAKALRGRAAEAVPLFRKALAALPDEAARKAATTNFLLDLADGRQPLEAYRVAPERREGFGILARHLFDRRQDALLRELMAVHRKVHGEDPVAHSYAAELHVEGKAYDKADREFAAALAGDWPAQERERLRSRRVFVRHLAGKGLSAYADIGPRRVTFEQLAGLFANPRDVKQLDALLAAHRRADPNDPQLPAWEAEARWLARDFAGTARLLQKHRKGLLADKRHRWKFYPRLLPSLVRLKRADEARKEVEGLLRGSDEDRREVGFLVNDFARGRDPEVLRILVAALEAAAPDGPDGLFYRARGKALSGRAAEAGFLLKLALARQEDAGQRQRYVNDFLLDSLDGGQPLQGYRAAPNPAVAFRVLAGALLNDVFDPGDFPGGPPPLGRRTPAKAREDLKRLLDAHRDKRPDDPELHFHEGELHLADKQYDKAEAAFAAAAREAKDELFRDRMVNNRVWARYQAGKGLSAYAEVGRTKRVFDQLAGLFLTNRKGKELLALVQARRKDAPNERSLPGWEAQARWLAGDSAGVLKILDEHREGVFADRDWLGRAHDLRVRCLARLRRTAEALAEARTPAGEGAGSPLLVAVLHALAGDVAKTRAALEEYGPRAFLGDTLYHDPDLGPALGSEAFRELRQRFPEPIPLPGDAGGQSKRAGGFTPPS